jgi:hypothetical protein
MCFPSWLSASVLQQTQPHSTIFKLSFPDRILCAWSPLLSSWLEITCQPKNVFLQDSALCNNCKADSRCSSSFDSSPAVVTFQLNSSFLGCSLYFAIATACTFSFLIRVILTSGYALMALCIAACGLTNVPCVHHITSEGCACIHPQSCFDGVLYLTLCSLFDIDPTNNGEYILILVFKQCVRPFDLALICTTSHYWYPARIFTHFRGRVSQSRIMLWPRT